MIIYQISKKHLLKLCWREFWHQYLMPQGKIYIGTSGWSYKHWTGIFYPPALKTTEWLKYYAQSFHSTEINMSFYRLPKRQTVEGWVKKVPPDFRFCPKMSRYVTHIKRLHNPEESLVKFFEVFELMRKKMGPILVQLPPSLKFDYDVAEHFFQVLKHDYRSYSFAIEVRHNTWMQEESFTLMNKYDIAFVISQSEQKFPYAEAVTAKNIYFRFHGPGQLYASDYTDDALKRFVNLFHKWQHEGHNIWTFFNNDVFGYALKNAKRLEELVKNI